jgi:outer membrane protein assembly factor BamB
LAASAILFLTGLNSCKKDYSKDTPLPDIYTPTLFVSSDNQIVYALDPISGAKKWKTTVDAGVTATPMINGNILYVGTTAGTLYGFDKQYGTQKVTRNFGAAIIGTPIMRNDMLLVVAGTKIFAVHPADLTDYYAPNVHPSQFDLGGAIMSSPTIHNIPGVQEKAIFISTMGGNVVALKPDFTGAIWTFTPTNAQGFYSSPCVVNDSFLYIGNDNGNVYSVYTQNGTQKWQFATGGQVRSSPIQIGGNVLVGSSDRNFYSVDSSTGLLRWKYTTGDAIQSSPVVFNQNVYFGSYDNYFYCIDIIDGHKIWDVPTQALIKSSPLIYNGDVYFGGFDKLLYRLDVTTGAQRINPVDINGQMQTSPIVDQIGSVAVPSISGIYQY